MENDALVYKTAETQELFLLAQHKNLCYNKSYENETMDLNGGNHEKN